MLILNKIPSVNQNQVDLYYKSLSFMEKIKTVFSPEIFLPSSYKGVSLYEDVVLLDLANILTIGRRYDRVMAVYNEQEPDQHKMINHTVYALSGVVAYGLLNNAKVCTVDRFDIQIDQCWKTYS